MKAKILFLVSLFVAAVTVHAQAAADVSKTYTVGDPFLISFVKATGTPPFTHQWQKDGVDIPGATADNITAVAIPLAAAGVYTDRVSNSAGSTITNKATVVVVPLVVPPGSGQIKFGFYSASKLPPIV